MEQKYPYASEEQVAYASILQTGMVLGFVMLVIAFGLYVFGVLEPHVPLDQLPNLWKLSAKDYLHATNTPVGWGWTNLIAKGDYLTFVGISFLSLVTIACFLRIIPLFAQKGDKAYLIISVVEVVVLALAASGLLVAGH